MEYVVIGLLALLVALSAKRTFAPTALPTLPPIRPLEPAPAFDGLFKLASLTTGAPKRLMVAIVAVESSFNPNSINLEKDADRRKGRDVDSIGLGQILWPDTAQALSPGITREALLDPETNLKLVGRLIVELLGRYPRLDPDGFPADAVASYNAGAPRFTPEGLYKNQIHVTRVREQWRKYANV